MNVSLINGTQSISSLYASKNRTSDTEQVNSSHLAKAEKTQKENASSKEPITHDSGPKLSYSADGDIFENNVSAQQINTAQATAASSDVQNDIDSSVDTVNDIAASNDVVNESVLNGSTQSVSGTGTDATQMPSGPPPGGAAPSGATPSGAAPSGAASSQSTSDDSSSSDSTYSESEVTNLIEKGYSDSKIIEETGISQQALNALRSSLQANSSENL